MRNGIMTVFAVTFLGIPSAPAQEQPPREQLAEALARENLAAVQNAVAAALEALGDQAGVPEVADSFLTIPKDGTWLTSEEARRGFERFHAEVERARWWEVGLDPSKLTHALREPAAVVSGGATAYRAGLTGAEHSLELARDAATFLIWAQRQAGTGLFPFPAFRGETPSKPFESARRFLDRAEQTGRLAEVMRIGWIIEDDSDGGLQFDNAEAAVAILELYEATREPGYLDAARRAADWAMTRPLVTNWNYNSFSVFLLAKTFQVTGDRQYLDAATRKALIGVIPGQLREGAHAGRWLDPHNARPAYHYIMLRSLAALLRVLPKDDAAQAPVRAALLLGLKARNGDFLGPGAPNKDKAMEVLLMVQRDFPEDEALLRESGSAEALDALGRLVSEEFRRDKAPLGPREWALFLAHAVARR